MEHFDDAYLGLNEKERTTVDKKHTMKAGPGTPAVAKGSYAVGKTRPSRMGSMALTKGRTKHNHKPKYVGHYPNLNKTGV